MAMESNRVSIWTSLISTSELVSSAAVVIEFHRCDYLVGAEIPALS